MPVRAWIVTGRVQGVGFRAFAVRTARTLGVSGWVRNRMTGEVEVVARGDSSVLEAFADALRQGPRFARVDGVTPRPCGEDDVSTSGFVVWPDR